MTHEDHAPTPVLHGRAVVAHGEGELALVLAALEANDPAFDDVRTIYVWAKPMPDPVDSAARLSP